MPPLHPQAIDAMSRRRALQLGALGLSLPTALSLIAEARAATASQTSGSRTGGKARSCIVLFAWGGLSHLDTFDLKPDASDDIRGAFYEIPTSVPGIRFGEHLPLLAKQAHRLAVVRSVHHRAAGHRPAAYWNLTGHPPPKLNANWDATRADWPSLGPMVWRTIGRDLGAMPGAAWLPYTMADGGFANGQDGGFFGLGYDPVILRPTSGAPYEGKSPSSGTISLKPMPGMTSDRMSARRQLLADLERSTAVPVPVSESAQVARWRKKALDMLETPAVRDAFDLEKEPLALRQKYGDHICGQSTLMARKLTEAGVPLVTVCCASGDLNGSVGAHFDTHADNFNRLKNQMLPPLDRAASALLDDLADRGRLDETLVVLLTEFGRTPKINGGAGRDHYPNCYSVAFAGGGIRGGMVYGKSDKFGARPDENGCSPADLHATIFTALGINPKTEIHDMLDRPLQMCEGEALPLFA